MQIYVKLFASFRNGRFNEVRQVHPPETDCGSIVRSLGLTETEIGIILVNSRHADLRHVLQNGDTLSLFPLIGGG